MSARPLFHRKITLLHRRELELAIAELKIWEVPKSEHYPSGVKFSVFLVSETTGEVIIGIDNHRPKGPHLHRGKKETPYEFTTSAQLIEDFWALVEREGFEI